jgi:hypothetical protein
MALTKITSRILDSSGVTILGTITTGVWQGSVIAEAYLQNQSGTNTGDQTNISGNAATATLADEATILANTRNINGVAFNGSTNITIADATKLPLAGGTLTGALVGTSATFNTGASRGIVLDNDSVDTPYNVISLNGTNVKGSYSGIAGGGTGNDNLYLNSADGVIVQTGSSFTPKLTILTGGNVGIGITPTYKLDVGGSSAVIRVKETSGTDVRIVSGGSIGYIGTYTDHELRLLTNGTEKLTISSGGDATFSGSVALGGATVANGYLLEISSVSSGNIMRSTRGSSQFSMYQSNNSDVYMGTTSNNRLRFLQNDGDALTIDTNKNIGIGTTSPSHKLSVKQNSYASGSDAPEAALGITIGDYWTTTAGAALTIKNAGHRGAIGHASGSPLFRADFNNATGMILDKNGNVGIGTASPSFATIDSLVQRGIEITGTKETGTAPVIRLSETGSGKGYFEIRSNRQASTSGNYLAFGESADTFMVIRGDDDSGGVVSRGNVGIGTASPTNPLHIKDTTNGFVGLRLEGSGNYLGSDWILYASSLNAPSSIDFFGIYNNNASNGATAGYKFKIDKYGLATFSNGIQFGTGDTLDAYEEGTWAVTLPGSSGASITTYRSRYTVVGNVCHFQLYVSVSSIPSNNNNLEISLPITPDGTSNDYTGVSMGYSGSFNTNSWLPITHNTAAYIYFHRNDGVGAAVTNAQAQGLSQIILSGHYYV